MSGLSLSLGLGLNSGGGGGAAAAVTPDTWNPADNAGTTLSNGDLTSTTPGGGWVGVRSAHSASGKRYCEIVMTTISNDMFGLGNASAVINGNYHASTANGVGLYGPAGQVYYNGGVLASYATPSPGDVLGIHHDEAADLIWFSRNGVLFAGDPTAGTGGLSVPGLGANPFVCFTSNGASVATIRTTTAEFQTQPVSGFTAWKTS